MSKRFQVAASPFNIVKLDLAIIAVIALILLIIIDRITDDFSSQLFLLFSYGVIALLWVVHKTRRVIAQHDPLDTDN